MGLIAPLKRVGRNLAYWAVGDLLGVAFGGTGAATASAGQFFAGPTSGSAAPPGFRGLAASDLAVIISASTPAMDGAAAAGTSGKAADAGHIHPSDTSRLAAANNLSDLASIAAALGNLGFNGYVSGSLHVWKIPFGSKTLIIQGNAQSISGDTSITFPNAFPTACLGVFPKATQNAGTVVYTIEIDANPGTGSFAARPRSITNGGQVQQYTSSCTFEYWAIGY